MWVIIRELQSPILLERGKPVAEIERPHTSKHLLLQEFAFGRDIGQNVEVVVHHAVCENVDAREVRHTPHPLDKARALLLAQVKRAVGDATDEMVAPVSCEIPRLSHAAYYSILPATPPLPTPPMGSDPPEFIELL